MSEETTVQALPLGPKSKSILIQVAFKAAVELTAAGQVPEGQKVGDTTDLLYAMLVAKHADHGAGDEPQKRGGGGGSYRKSSGGGGGGSTGDKIFLDLFGTGQPVEFWDNRDSKPTPRSPDFKSVEKLNYDGKFDNVPLWLTTPKGDPIQEVQELVAKAGGGATGGASASDEAPF